MGPELKRKVCFMFAVMYIEFYDPRVYAIVIRSTKVMYINNNFNHITQIILLR